MTDLRPWLRQLEKLPFVDAIRVDGSDGRADLVIHLRAGKRTHHLEVEVKPHRVLSPAVLGQLIEHPKRRRSQVMLFARHVPTALGERLSENDIAYLDLAGNCHLRLGDDHFVHVEGKKPPDYVPVMPTREREPGFHIYFALAARPELASAPVRQLAELAGTGKSAAADVVSRLVHDGVLAKTRQRRMVVHRDQLIERWVVAYMDRARSKWLAGRFRPAERDADAIEKRVAGALRGTTWGFGGSAAAMRLDRFYRGPETVVHLKEGRADLPALLRAPPDREGPLSVIVTPIPLAFESPEPDTVHPLLVYSELVAANDDRSLQAAARLRERFLTEPR